MGIEVIEGFNHADITRKLKKMGKEARPLCTITEFIFSDCITDLTDELNNEFRSKGGNKAIPRALLLGAMLYGFHKHAHNLSDIASECKTNSVLKIFTCDRTPCETTFRRFLENSDELTLKKIFLYTLVQLNDLDFLKFLRAFVDGTDALVKGSKHYKITREELEALKLMKSWGLLHENTPKSMKKSKKKLLKKLKKFKGNEEVLSTIELILGRLTFFNEKNSKRINEFEEAFSQTNKNYICVKFPSSVMMPTKKGGHDFGFNLQEIMTEYNIILTGILLNEPNDSMSMDEILSELKENFTILLELIEKYGCRRNYKEIKSMLEKATFVFDSGYFSDENLEALDKHENKGLIMPKLISRQKNNELREKNGLPTKEKNYNLKKYGKKDFTRINNGYMCKAGHKLELVEIKEINSKMNRRKGIADSWKEQSYIHKCHACETCLIKDKCLSDSEFRIIIDRVSPLKYEMYNKFTQKRYLDIYKERFHVSEGINGYLKNTNGILLLVGSNKNAVKNEMHLKNTMYNLTRIKNLKGTAY